MQTLIALLLALVVFSLVVWIVEQVPLPVVPKRLALALCGIIALVYLCRRLSIWP